MTTPEDFLDPPQLTSLQWDRLGRLLNEVLPNNRFYAAKLATAATSKINSADDLARLPFTTKTELLADQLAEPPSSL